MKAPYNRRVLSIERSVLKGSDWKKENSRTHLGKLTDKLYPLSTLKWEYVSDNSIFKINWTFLHYRRKRLCELWQNNYDKQFIYIINWKKKDSPHCHSFRGLIFNLKKTPWRHHPSASRAFHKQATITQTRIWVWLSMKRSSASKIRLEVFGVCRNVKSMFRECYFICFS